MKPKPSSFRLSEQAKEILSTVANKAGESETAIIEICIAAHAIQVGVEVEGAKAFLLDRITKHLPGDKRKRK